MAEKADTAESDQLDAPEPGKPQTQSEAADSIADLLGADPETDTGTKSAEEDEDASNPLGDEEDVETDKGDDKDDGSKSTAGKYVSPTAKYKLADGTEITVAELARNNLFQRDYSKKTEEVARDRDAVTKEKADVTKLSTQLREERQYLIWFAEQFAPKPPTPPSGSVSEDPMGHLEYQEAARKYQAFAESWRQFKAAQEQDGVRQKGETEQQAQQRAKKEVEALFSKVKIDHSEVEALFSKVKIDPSDAPKATAFFNAIEKGASEFYGLSASDIAGLARQDHRTILVLRDAIRGRQNKKAAPEVEARLRQVPKMVRTPTARSAPNQQQARVVTQTGENLRKDSSMRNGIAAIEALLSQ